ncbi:efflux RND transporter permease subunit [Haliovirga abyssi]|uniref:Acriflavin resistance protein n=1 Tax=Haliovirga abyssi TaxID=2996794 RepID=A0AAU9D9G3_9FUSO|nr:efflux RND transporter permease subunit [Haliovirga abyssi]BDU49930.1 acriflavin resistance protein [Haliovirga abyssi]
MKLVEFSIKRPVAMTMIIITMLVAGVIAMLNMSAELMPDFDMPIVSVKTTWVGASPEDMDKLVTEKIEDALSGIDGVDKVTSYSGQNYSYVIVEFDYGVDTDKKVDLIQNEVSKIRGKLPSDITDPYVTKMDVTGGTGVATVEMSGADLMELKGIADNTIKPRLQQIKGVGSVEVSGGLEKRILIEIDPNRLANYNMDVSSVVNILKASNINIPGGMVYEGDKEMLIRVMGEIKTLEQVKNIVISNKNNEILRLKDICNVNLTTKKRETYSRLNGKTVLSLNIKKTKDGNAVEIVKKLKEELKDMKNYISSDIDLKISYDSSKEIGDSINTVVNNGLTGLVLAAIILLLFLKNMRTSGIVAMAIPTSIIFAVFLLKVKGVSLNRISLLGLALGVGMVVDNSIVVIDNIYRKITEEGEKVFEAVRDGASEMAVPIIASTATSVAVFAPILFTNGMAKEIFQDLAYSIIFSLLASIIIALTFVPMVASKILKSGEKKDFDGKLFTKVKFGYHKLLDSALKHKAITLFITGIVFFGAIFFGVKNIEMEFMPKVDNAQYNVTAELPKGLDIEKANRIAYQMEKIVKNDKNTIQYATVVKKDEVNINVDVIKKNKRRESIDEITKRMREKLKVIPDAKMKFSLGFGPSGGDIQLQLLGRNQKILVDVSNEIKNKMRSIDGFTDVKSSFEGGNPEGKIVIDRTKAQYYGLRVAQINQIISYQILGTEPFTIKTDDEEVDVSVQLMKKYKNSSEKLMEMRIKTPTGKTIQLKDIAELKVEEGPSEIVKENKIKKITLSANSSTMALKTAEKQIKEVINNMELPKGVTYKFGGESEQFSKVMKDLTIALALAIFLIYFILATQFESFILPLIVMGTLPLSVIGIIIGLVITGTNFSMMVMIGIIMLAGIVVNNAIVLIDYIHSLREKGVELVEAIKKGGETRLRPILMTTFTTIFGMIPLALGIGEGSEFFKGMAISVIFGLGFATLLTLVVIPVMYSIVEGIKEKRKIRKEIK